MKTLLVISCAPSTLSPPPPPPNGKGFTILYTHTKNTYKIQELKGLESSAHWIQYFLLYIEFNYLNVNAFLKLIIIGTNPKFNIVSGGGTKLFEKPWRLIE